MTIYLCQQPRPLTPHAIFLGPCGPTEEVHDPTNVLKNFELQIQIHVSKFKHTQFPNIPMELFNFII
jgi:hypothetical protein